MSKSKLAEPEEFKLVKEMMQELHETYFSQGQTLLFKIRGYIQSIKVDDKMIYKACPDCSRKVFDEMNGYRCENCNKVQPTCNETYMLNAKLSDLSGSQYITFPKELG
mmetsp:Transcript_22973/g.17415  ORF Transcript_22973/g.17415 Transcript_22973/m.17415 type:complete len:108 (+) Transcript_22973:1237-1560(+)